MNIKVLTEKRVGLAEHGDLIITIEEELDKLANFEDRQYKKTLYIIDDTYNISYDC